MPAAARYAPMDEGADDGDAQLVAAMIDEELEAGFGGGGGDELERLRSRALTQGAPAVRWLGERRARAPWRVRRPLPDGSLDRGRRDRRRRAQGARRVRGRCAGAGAGGRWVSYPYPYP